MSRNPSVGLFVPLVANPTQEAALASFLLAGRQIVNNEPLTLQWYAVKYTESLKTGGAVEAPTFAIFDTFAGEEGRGAHLTGKVAEALLANAPTLLASGPEISKVDILASKVQPSNVSVGLRVLAEAKRDKVDAVRKFLIDALPLVEAETLTPQWYAVQLHDVSGPSNVFGILDFSEGEEGRQAHLNGAVAAALFANAEEFFVSTPEVIKVDVIASRVLS